VSIIKQNIVANFGGKAWTALMSIAFVPLYIKFMGIESYGLVGIFASLLALFSLLDMGLSTTLNRELARFSALPDKAQDMRNLVRTLELPYWGIAALIGIVVISLSGPIANHWINVDKLAPETVKHALMIMGGVVSFRWPVSLYSGGLMGLQKHVLLNGVNAGVATLRGFGAIMVLWLISSTIQAFFAWQILISIVHVSLVAVCLWRNLPMSRHRPHFQKESLLRIWRFAAGMTGISFTVIFLTQTDKIVLSKILSLEMFGYYTLATVVAHALYLFIGPVFSALFPRLSQLVSMNDQNGLKELYHKSCQLMSVIILPAAIVISLFSSEILLLWTGDPITVANTHSIVSILIIGSALNGLLNLPYGLQLAHGWTKLALYTNIIASIVLVPMIFILAKHYGPVGAAVAWVTLNSGQFLISIQIMHRRLLPDEKWRWYLNDVAVPMMTTIIVAVIWRLLLPGALSRVGMFVYLFGISATTLLAATYATTVTRQWINHKIVMLKVLYEG
jgi:O-antigen/teichoic acid export membrane protein